MNKVVRWLAYPRFSWADVVLYCVAMQFDGWAFVAAVLLGTLASVLLEIKASKG